MLSVGQLGQILQRGDLHVSREEVILEAIFKLFNRSKEHVGLLALLLRDVDFQSMSSDNLGRTSHFASSLGGDEMHRKVDEALHTRRTRIIAETSDTFRPKRRCLQSWSPHLGASLSRRKVLLERLCLSLCWHEGALYATDCNGSSSCSVLCLKSGDEGPRIDAGNGARASGTNDLRFSCQMSISPSGEIFVACLQSRRLVSFKNGHGTVVCEDVKGLNNVFCAQNCVIYLLTHGGRAVQMLNGSNLQAVIHSDDLDR